MNDESDDGSETNPDELEKEIESELQEHGQLSYKELVSRLTVSVDTLKTRLKSYGHTTWM